MKASVISMQADFNLQLNALRFGNEKSSILIKRIHTKTLMFRRELEEERMARTRLEQEVVLSDLSFFNCLSLGAQFKEIDIQVTSAPSCGLTLTYV